MFINVLWMNNFKNSSQTILFIMVSSNCYILKICISFPLNGSCWQSQMGDTKAFYTLVQMNLTLFLGFGIGEGKNKSRKILCLWQGVRRNRKWKAWELVTPKEKNSCRTGRLCCQKNVYSHWSPDSWGRNISLKIVCWHRKLLTSLVDHSIYSEDVMDFHEQTAFIPWELW